MTGTEARPDRDWSTRDWIDVSRPVAPGTPVWPGDRPVELEQHSDDGVLVSAIATTCHVATHVDAPRHLDETGATVDEIPLERLIGPAEVVRVACEGSVAGPGHLPAGWSPASSRVLLRTDSHPVGAAIGDGFVAVSVELVHWLADRGVRTLGIDTPSVDVAASTDLASHRALIARGMTWIEGLDLGRAAPGPYLLVALPILLRGVEAAPLRAILSPLHERLPGSQ